MALQAKELMIGDLVHLYVNDNGITNEDVKVVGLSEDYITILNKFGIDEEYCEDDVIDGVSAIFPISLTPEIGKANGFQYSTDKDEVEWYLKQNSYPYEDWGYTFEHNVFEYENIGLSVRKQLYYVHEFQHALRLCGLSELADNFKIE